MLLSGSHVKWFRAAVLASYNVLLKVVCWLWVCCCGVPEFWFLFWVMLLVLVVSFTVFVLLAKVGLGWFWAVGWVGEWVGEWVGGW